MMRGENSCIPLMNRYSTFNEESDIRGYMFVERCAVSSCTLYFKSNEYSMFFASPLPKSGEYLKVFCLSSGLLRPFGLHQARARGSSCRLLHLSGLAQASGTPMRMLAIARTALQPNALPVPSSPRFPKGP